MVSFLPVRRRGSQCLWPCKTRGSCLCLLFRTRLQHTMFVFLGTVQAVLKVVHSPRLLFRSHKQRGFLSLSVFPSPCLRLPGGPPLLFCFLFFPSSSLFLDLGESLSERLLFGPLPMSWNTVAKTISRRKKPFKSFLREWWEKLRLDSNLSLSTVGRTTDSTW